MTTDSSTTSSTDATGQNVQEKIPVRTPPARRTWRRFVRDVLLYLVTYVIVSGVLIGPMFWIWFGAVYADGPKWVAYLFLPLAVLCEKVPFLCWLINEWVNWWIL